MNPTREQVESARTWLAENWNLAPDPRDLTDEGVERTVQMVAVLLAATELPGLAALWRVFRKAKAEASAENPRLTDEASDLAGLDAIRATLAATAPPIRHDDDEDGSMLYGADCGARREGRR